MIIGIITARKGSKGIPNKNLTPLGGKALIEYTFEVASDCPGLDRVFLTTDSQEVIDLARAEYPRIEAPFVRPAQLAGDNSSHVEVVNHLLTYLKDHSGVRPEAFALLQPTSPFRRTGEIQDALALFRKQRLKSLLGVAPVMHHPADYVWRRRGEKQSFEEVLVRPPGIRRQDLPEVFFISGALFICNCDWYWANQRFYDHESHLFQMSQETLMDIDTPFDLQLATGYLMVSSHHE